MAENVAGAIIGCRDWYREGWLKAVQEIDQRTEDARRQGDLEELDHGILKKCYEFEKNVLKPWTIDPNQPDTPPEMEP